MSSEELHTSPLTEVIQNQDASQPDVAEMANRLFPLPRRRPRKPLEFPELTEAELANLRAETVLDASIIATLAEDETLSSVSRALSGLTQIKENAYVPNQILTPKVRLATRYALTVGGVVAGAGLGMLAIPYHGEAAGWDLEISAHPLGGTGVSGSTNLGPTIFSKVDKLPVRFDVSPTLEHLSTVSDIAPNPGAYLKNAEKQIGSQSGAIAEHFVLDGLIGGAIGGLCLFGAGSWFLAAEGSRIPSANKRARQAGIAAGVAIANMLTAASVGVASWDTTKFSEHSSTHAISEFDIFRQIATKMNEHDGSSTTIQNALDEVDHTLAEGEALNQPTAPEKAPAVRFVHVSDMHMLNDFDVLDALIEPYNPNFVIMTGDQFEKGTTAESTYVDPGWIQGLTKFARPDRPVFVIKGNHDSDADMALLAAIPNVYVLDKQMVEVDGNWIAGVGDERDYGGEGDTGGVAEQNDQRDDIKAIESNSATASNPANKYDIVMDHEPWATQEIASLLPKNSVRLIAYGHRHQQNDVTKMQPQNGMISAEEGSTGAGGIIPINPVPMAFSIFTETSNCQFYDTYRAQLDPRIFLPWLPKSDSRTSVSFTHVFQPQPAVMVNRNGEKRYCSADLGIQTPVMSWTDAQPGMPTTPTTVEAAGGAKAPAPTQSPVPVG